MFKLSAPLVLASTSAVREKLLHATGIPFTMIQPGCDEEKLRAEMGKVSPEKMATALARAKAASVNAIHPGWLVIGGDQICVMGKEILSKPGTKENAVAQLKKMRGKTHRQLSAVCLFHEGKVIWETVEEATLTLRDLTDEEIAAYVALDNPVNACGSYTYEIHGRHLFSKVEGKEEVIMGLPVQALLNILYQKQMLRLE